MTSDLFPDCRQDSPRLAWMERNGVTLNYWKETGVWTATAKGRAATDDTDEGALANLSIKLGIPLWNEEEYINGKEAE